MEVNYEELRARNEQFLALVLADIRRYLAGEQLPWPTRFRAWLAQRFYDLAEWLDPGGY